MIEMLIALAAIFIFVGIVMLIDRYQRNHPHKQTH